MALTKVSYSMIDGPYVNVTDYGVVGDGSTDDSDALQPLTFILQMPQPTPTHLIVRQTLPI